MSAILKFFHLYNFVASKIVDCEEAFPRMYAFFIRLLTKLRQDEFIGLIKIIMAEKTLEEAVEAKKLDKNSSNVRVVGRGVALLIEAIALVGKNEELQSRVCLDTAYIYFHANNPQMAVYYCQLALNSDPENEAAQVLMQKVKG